MTRMKRLKQEAREASSLLGHRLGRFRQSVITRGTTPRAAAVAACVLCGALALVDPASPDPEERLTGEAVGRQCFGMEQEGHETA